MINELLKRYPQLDACVDTISQAREMLIKSFEENGKLLLCGNGGSCADCDHIVGELMKGFLKLRPLSADTKASMKKNCPSLADSDLCKLQGGLPAISLPSFAAINSAFCNDVDPELVYAQTTLALADKQDILFALSTSGNSKNVVHAAEVARAKGAKVIALTGVAGGKLRDIADVCVCVPETETFKVQELHLPVYHYLCAAIEEYFF